MAIRVHITFCRCVFLLFLLAFSSVFGLPELGHQNHQGNIYEMIFVGTVGGKSYFTDGTVGRNWIEARAFCNASNLELAALENRAEVEMLRSKRGTWAFDGVYWTSARDALLSRQFSWDTTNSAPSEDIALNWFPNFGSRHPFESCAVLSASADNFHMLIVTCKENYSTLCQTPFVNATV